MKTPLVISIAFFSILVLRTAPSHAALDGSVDNGSPSVATALPDAAPVRHSPRLALSYRRFPISNLDTTKIPLAGLELDSYVLSTPWLHAGFEFEGGTGRAAFADRTVDVKYGLAGVTAGLQIPARISPFIEGRLFGGLLGGSVDQPITIPGTSMAIPGTSAATWIYGRGVDVGLDLYAIGPVYVTAAVGWLRTTWRGVDYAAMTANPSAGIQTKDLTADGYTLKLGLGF